MKNILDLPEKNLLIVGGCSTGKTSILKKIIDLYILKNKNDIYLLDGENELINIYKNEVNIKGAYTFISLRVFKKFLTNLKEGDVIFIDTFNNLEKNIQDELIKLLKDDKYIFIITADNPICVKDLKFEDVVCMSTDKNYSNYLNVNTYELLKGDYLLNRESKQSFPYAAWIYEKEIEIKKGLLRQKKNKK